MLIRKGANISAVDNYGWTVFHFATYQFNSHVNFKSILDMLINTTNTMLSNNTLHNNPINALDRDSRTPLMYAVLSNSEIAVKTLLDANADISILDKNGLTAYYMTDSENIKSLIADTHINKVMDLHSKWSENEISTNMKPKQKPVKQGNDHKITPLVDIENTKYTTLEVN
jgi:ankyrin repeat protein